MGTSLSNATPGMVVELDEDHRAVDPVVERATRRRCRRTSENQVSSRWASTSVIFDLGVPVAGPADVGADQGEAAAAAGRRSSRRPATPWYGATRLSWKAPACIRPSNRFCRLGGDLVGMDRRVDDRPVALARVERADQVEPERSSGSNSDDAGERTAGDAHGSDTHEGRRHHEPAVEHHGVDAQVVAVDLPTPRFVRAGRPEDRHEVRPLAERLVVAGELGEQLVERA